MKRDMDIVFIKQLKVYAIVGLFPWERKVPQELVFDLALASDIAPAARSKNIKDALNYAEVANSVSEFVQVEQFTLLETLLEESAALVMRKFSVPWLSISCTKTQVMANTLGVGLSIERGDPSVLSSHRRATQLPTDSP